MPLSIVTFSSSLLSCLISVVSVFSLRKIRVIQKISYYIIKTLATAIVKFKPANFMAEKIFEKLQKLLAKPVAFVLKC
jgi:hypothetical protein